MAAGTDRQDGGADALHGARPCGTAGLPGRTLSRSPRRAADEPVQLRPPADHQAIATVIGRRRCEQDPADQWLNLHGATLPGVEWRKAHLERANLSGAHLEQAHLSEPNLEGAYLVERLIND